MVDNATAITYYNTMHQNALDIGLGLMFIVGLILGAFVVAIIVDYQMKQLRMTGIKMSRKGVYLFKEHTAETMKEYLDYRKKEKQLS